MLKLEYWNSCDIGNIIYQFGYKNVMYFNLDVGVPVFETIEEGVEDGDKNFIPQFTKMIKKYKFYTLLPEYQFDVLNFASLHDYKMITLANEESSRCLTFQVENKGWDNNGSDVQVEVSFSVDYIVKTNCCNTILSGAQKCIACEKTLEGIVESGSLPYINPFSLNKVNRYYIVYDELTLPSDLMQLTTDLLWKPAAYWNYVCLTLGGINYKWYKDGSGKYRIYQYLQEYVSGTPTIFRAFCLPSTYAQLYISTDNITFVASGSPVYKNIAETAGISVSLAAGTWYVKFLMYNINCNYGYSNTITVNI